LRSLTSIDSASAPVHTKKYAPAQKNNGAPPAVKKQAPVATETQQEPQSEEAVGQAGQAQAGVIFFFLARFIH